jgi:mono/diheme cytochrome c family protein
MREVLVGAAVLALAGGGGLQDYPASASKHDPLTGREIYANTCLVCHGIDGKGARGIQLVPAPADLTSAKVQDRLDASLFKRIHDGKPDTAMGAWKNGLTDEEIWDVLAYIRTLRQE